MASVEPLPTGVEWPPTEDELPCNDGIPMETQRHMLQLYVLMDPLLLHWADRQDVFVGGNMFVYFSLEQVRHQDFRGPDFFVVLDVPRRERKSWVVWQEGKGPDVVIELLSESTAAQDKGEKKQIYQERLRVPEYFWFDPFSGEWAGFALREGVYMALDPDAQERLVSQRLGLALVRWEGTYQGITAGWLRWATLEGALLPTPQEAAERARQQAEAARQQAEAAQQRAAELETLLARYRQRFGDLAE
ncbi:MAG: Uma2 family endonuclease [Nitrospinae bacterium]|nr:Uma2 family endonuclease [Nitrospinota bacterium]